MYSVDLYNRVRRACHVDGMSKSAAGRLYGIDRKTVAKILLHSVPPGYRRTALPVRPKLDPFIPIIDQILEDDKRVIKKQRHTAKRIHARLRYGNTVVVTATQTAEVATLRVTDLGPGIPEADLERVFEPFFRLESSRSRNTGGTGLGLSIARTILRAHGGDVVLSNRDAGGLCVVVTLPLAPVP